MYVYGGHVLSYDPDTNKKRRRFFNDLWCLDTVGCVTESEGNGLKYHRNAP